MFVPGDAFDTPHREEIVCHCQMGLGRDDRSAPIVKVTKIDGSHCDARCIDRVEYAEQFLSRGVKDGDDDISGFEFHGLIFTNMSPLWQAVEIAIDGQCRDIIQTLDTHSGGSCDEDTNLLCCDRHFSTCRG